MTCLVQSSLAVSYLRTDAKDPSVLDHQKIGQAPLTPIEQDVCILKKYEFLTWFWYVFLWYVFWLTGIVLELSERNNQN